MRISFNRRAGGLLATALIATAGVIVAAQPAYALGPWVHVTTFKNGARGTCNVSVTPYYDYGAVDDNKEDGVGVYCRFKLSNGTIRDVADLDGYGGNSGILDLRDTPYYIKEMQAVARNLSSSPWTPTGG